MDAATRIQVPGHGALRNVKQRFLASSSASWARALEEGAKSSVGGSVPQGVIKQLADTVKSQ